MISPSTFPATDKIELRVNGLLHSGWKTASVQTAIDSLASSFDLTLSDKWPSDDVEAVVEAGPALEQISVEAGASCEILIGGEVLISGYIDAVDPDLSGEDHSIRIAGRSKAADLIDCSAVHSPGSWNGRRLEDIVATLIAPFGLTVTAAISTGEAFKTFALQPGETVFAAIERMCKMRGLLPISDASGNIIIMRPQIGGSAVRIEQGKHFTAANARHSVANRFSQIIVKGQAAGDECAELAGRRSGGRSGWRGTRAARAGRAR